MGDQSGAEQHDMNGTEGKVYLEDEMSRGGQQWDVAYGWTLDG